jgi:hypothetical protein
MSLSKLIRVEYRAAWLKKKNIKIACFFEGVARNSL